MVTEEKSQLLGRGSKSSRSTGIKDMTSDHDATRRRLALCLFLHILGASVVLQVYPKVVLEHFEGNDGEASRFNGWVTFAASIVQLIAIPSISGASDIVGRRPVLFASLATHGAAVLTLGINVNSIVACAAVQGVTGVCGVVLPVSQAIIIDLSRGSDAERGEVARGLGLIGAAFGLAIGVGPVLGGSLAENNRRAACVLSAAVSFVSVLSGIFYGWKETAPELLIPQSTDATGGSACGKFGAWLLVNPFSVLKVFLVSRLLMRLALCLFLFCMSLNVFSIWYNYFDFQFHWGALDISFFFSAFGLAVALTSGVGIRFLVPQRLSEEQGVVLGLALQGLSAILYGSVPYGWMLYPVILITLLQFITEPCIQSIMARLVGADRQGSLQGAVMSLRVLAQGIAGPAYGQVFSFGVSDSIKKALGFLVPGLPLFVAATFSLTSCMVGWCSVAKDPDSVRKATEVLEGPAPADTFTVLEGGNGSGPTAHALGLEHDKDDKLTLATMSINESDAGTSSDGVREDMIREPLLGASSNSDSS